MKQLIITVIIGFIFGLIFNILQKIASDYVERLVVEQEYRF